MEKIPTAEEFLIKENFTNSIEGHSSGNKTTSEMMIEFAKLHVEAALKEASGKAKITERKKVIDNTGGYVRIPTIYKKHILNAYSIDNIK